MQALRSLAAIIMSKAERLPAVIFRRGGQKAELGGNQNDQEDRSKLEVKLSELHQIWSAPRVG